ncbi:hypothetical protein AA11825_0653 [Acetobacter pomorum DSM 11825]|nr:hypothetical protein AA11825_0653 [Acetobacter pomorum DSM 11825]
MIYVGDITPAELLRGRTTGPLQEEEEMHIVDDIGQSNFHGGPCDTDGAHEQPHL